MRKAIGWAMLGSVPAAPLVAIGVQSGFAEMMFTIAFVIALFAWIYVGLRLLDGKS